jgi:hypothetical protein
MLGGRYHESLPIAQEAHSIARTAGQRQLEGHAATTLGTDLVYASPTGEETGIELIRGALVIADEVHDIDDIGRGYACLSSVLDVVDRVEEGLAAAEEGVERMRELGLSASYGAFIQMNVVDALISLGRWHEALQLTEASEPISRGNGRIFANLQLARLYTLRGSFDAAEQALDHAASRLAGASEAQFTGPLSVTRMDLALWLHDIAAARAVADESCRRSRRPRTGVRFHGSTRGGCASRRTRSSVHARRATTVRSTRRSAAPSCSYRGWIGSMTRHSHRPTGRTSGSGS